MRPYILAETNWKHIKTEDIEVAVLPWGACEAHNYHLPYGTDIIEAEQVASEASRIAYEKGAKVVVLPVIPFGVNTGQIDVKLDINMNPSTQLLVLRDIVHVLNHQRIRKLIILNSHGANDFKNMIREIGLTYPDMFLMSCTWFLALDQKMYFTEKDDHGGAMETSVMQHLRPDLVRPLHEAGDGKAKKFRFKAIREGWAWAERKWPLVTHDTGVGNPHNATAEKGAKFFRDTTEKVAALILDVAKSDPSNPYE